jgi:predicted dehydrogenase
VYEELYRLAEEKGLIYMEAIMPRHTYARPRVKEAVAAIGPIREAIFDFSQYSSRLDAYLGGERQNIFDLSLWGGCLMDLGIYCAWGAVDLLGAPKSATATATFLPPGADGEGEAALDYGTFCARLIYRKTRQGAEGSVIRGEQGEVRIAHISQYAGVTLTVGDKTQTLVEVPPRVQVMLGEVEAFARYITQPDATREDYEALYQDTRAVHTLMECLRKSANIPYGKQT